MVSIVDRARWTPPIKARERLENTCPTSVLGPAELACDAPVDKAARPAEVALAAPENTRKHMAIVVCTTAEAALRWADTALTRANHAAAQLGIVVARQTAVCL